MSRMGLCSSDVSCRFLTYTLTCVRGYPAYAGMDPFFPSSVPTCWGLPRLRGDGPVRAGSGDSSIKATPPTRGWTLGTIFYTINQAGYPAYAGMDPYVSA